jgi:hypothetical protein
MSRGRSTFEAVFPSPDGDWVIHGHQLGVARGRHAVAFQPSPDLGRAGRRREVRGDFVEDSGRNRTTSGR